MAARSRVIDPLKAQELEVAFGHVTSMRRCYDFHTFA